MIFIKICAATCAMPERVKSMLIVSDMTSLGDINLLYVEMIYTEFFGCHILGYY